MRTVLSVFLQASNFFRIQRLGDSGESRIVPHDVFGILSPLIWGFPMGSDSKESACRVGGPGSILGLGRSPGEGNGNPFQYSCLENPMDRGDWQATVPGVTESWPQLTEQHTHTSLIYNNLAMINQPHCAHDDFFPMVSLRWFLNHLPGSSSAF